MAHSNAVIVGSPAVISVRCGRLKLFARRAVFARDNFTLPVLQRNVKIAIDDRIVPLNALGGPATWGKSCLLLPEVHTKRATNSHHQKWE